MKREMTNSVTHLVQIIAKEVVDKEIKKHEEKTENMLISSLNKAGTAWSEYEERVLQDEIITALKQIARNHDRSFGAIHSRVKHKIYDVKLPE